MEVSDYIRFVASEGDRFAAAAERGGLDVAIEPCPGWVMRDLVRHLGMIHLWAAANVAFPEPDWLDVEELPDLVRYWPDLAGPSGEYPDDDDLIPWYRETLANLVEVLTSAPADVPAFTWLPAPTPLTMWARRQASEIAIHRFDAEQANDIVSAFDPDFAVDMLDELLTGFAPRPRKMEVETTQVLHVDADDVDESWFLTIGPEGIDTTRHPREADLHVRAPAADLYATMWNRTPPSSPRMTGDTALMTLWHNNCRVRWG